MTFRLLSLAALFLATPLGTAYAADCNARISIPWEKAGPGYFADAIVRGPSCANAVVLFVARRPGGEPHWYRDPPDKVVAGNAPVALEIKPVAGIPALAKVADAAAMTKALQGWLVQRLLDQEVPKPPANLAALVAAGRTKGDCATSASLPWTAAGRGYRVDVFSDGSDCYNAATALVIRAPDGRPLYSTATPGYIVEIYSSDLATKADMAKALGNVRAMLEGTTESLPEWPADQRGREIKRGDFTTVVVEPFDRTSWNALRAAKRPMLPINFGIESSSLAVLMPDGRIVLVGRHQQS